MDKKDFTFIREKPLDRCQGEGLRANIALHDYAFMGPGRSLRKLLAIYVRRQNDDKANTGVIQEPPTQRFTTLDHWSSHYKWQERIAAWETIQQREAEQRWQERRDRHREDEWLLRDQLVELARSIIAEAPKFTKTRRRYVKETKQEIVTVALDGAFLLKTVELASKVGRLSAGMETERQQHDVNIVDISADDMARARERAATFDAEMMGREPPIEDSDENDETNEPDADADEDK